MSYSAAFTLGASSFGCSGGRACDVNSSAEGAAPGGGGGSYQPGGDGYVDANGAAHAGDGGPGRICAITGIDRPYGAGGGGAANAVTSFDTYAAGAGGSGIGGAGGAAAQAGSAAVANTGSGGGGGSWSGSPQAGGDGSDGIVIFRYAYTEVAPEPQVLDTELSAVRPGSADLSTMLLAFGSDATSCDLWVIAEDDDGNVLRQRCVTGATELKNYTVRADGLKPGTDYTCYLLVSNNLGKTCRYPESDTFAFSTPAGTSPVATGALAGSTAYALWDAADNAGLGAHDDTALVWKNLISGSPDVNYSSGTTPTWTDNAYHSQISAKTYFFLSSDTFMSGLGASWTAQLLITPDAGFFQSNGYPSVCGCYDSASQGMELGHGDTSYHISGMTTSGAATRTGILCTGDASFVGQLLQVTLTATPTLFTLYTNGVAAAEIVPSSTSHSQLSSTFFSIGSCVKGTDWCGNRIFPGKIHAVRLYSSALGASEILSTWAFDRTRTGGESTFTVTDMSCANGVCRAKLSVSSAMASAAWDVWAAWSSTYADGDWRNWEHVSKVATFAAGTVSLGEVRLPQCSAGTKYLCLVLLPKDLAPSSSAGIVSPLYYVPELPLPRIGTQLIVQ